MYTVVFLGRHALPEFAHTCDTEAAAREWVRRRIANRNRIVTWEEENQIYEGLVPAPKRPESFFSYLILENDREPATPNFLGLA